MAGWGWVLLKQVQSDWVECSVSGCGAVRFGKVQFLQRPQPHRRLSLLRVASLGGEDGRETRSNSTTTLLVSP